MAEVTTESVTFPVTAKDALNEILKQGAQQMLVHTIEPEVFDWIDVHSQETDASGRRRRPEGEREKFTSRMLPPYLRTKKGRSQYCSALGLLESWWGEFSMECAHGGVTVRTSRSVKSLSTSDFGAARSSTCYRGMRMP